jgi:hypothetical protein
MFGEFAHERAELIPLLIDAHRNMILLRKRIAWKQNELGMLMGDFHQDLFDELLVTACTVFDTFDRAESLCQSVRTYCIFNQLGDNSLFKYRPEGIMKYVHASWLDYINVNEHFQYST